MLDTTTKTHLERLKNQTINKFSIDEIPAWIEANTTLMGQPFSFLNHEYQKRILSDVSSDVVIRKCSQVGLTEASLRQALALCALQPYYTVIMTMPTSSFAANVMTTRVDPIIDNSRYLKELIDKETNNSRVKQLGNSFFYMNGSASGNAPISIPADHLIHDEIDFSDLGIIEQYQSRLTHSPYKRKTKLSTPTQPGFGIDREFRESRRHFNMVKCNHCNHYFIPDYYEHVVIPGFTGDLQEINKNNLPTVRWQEAYLACPKCGKEPSLQIEHREWVCENPDENYVAVGYQVSPFDAPNIITPSYLIEASTKYDRRSQFINFNLGLPVEDSESSLLTSELRNAIIPPHTLKSASYVMGIDMGTTCHVVIMACVPDGTLIIVHCEEVHHTRIVERRVELAKRYWPRMTVVDALPYTETVYRMQGQDPNLFAAFYVERNSIETHKVVDKEEEKEKAQVDLRQVNINRNKAFDALMNCLRQGFLKKISDDTDEAWITQLQDMKRIEKFTGNNELEHVWSKSREGNDHYHHATLYAKTAAEMLGVSHFRPMRLPVLTTFKNRMR